MFEQVVKMEHVREGGAWPGIGVPCAWLEGGGSVPGLFGLACAILISPAAGNLRGGVTKQFYLSCPRNGGLASGRRMRRWIRRWAAICGLLPSFRFPRRWAVGNYDICICSSCSPRRRKRGADLNADSRLRQLQLSRHDLRL